MILKALLLAAANTAQCCWLVLSTLTVADCATWWHQLHGFSIPSVSLVLIVAHACPGCSPPKKKKLLWAENQLVGQKIRTPSLDLGFSGTRALREEKTDLLLS